MRSWYFSNLLKSAISKPSTPRTSSIINTCGLSGSQKVSMSCFTRSRDANKSYMCLLSDLIKKCLKIVNFYNRILFSNWIHLDRKELKMKNKFLKCKNVVLFKNLYGICIALIHENEIVHNHIKKINLNPKSSLAIIYKETFICN